MEENLINDFVESLEQSLSTNNYFAAISSAMVLPDICAKIEYENIETVGQRYKMWTKKYLIPLLDKELNGSEFISSENLYALRCSILHIGSSNPSLQDNYIKKVKEAERIDEIVPFVQLVKESPKLLYANSRDVETNHTKKTLFIEINYFCNLIIQAIKNWMSQEGTLVKIKDQRNLFSIAFQFEDKKNEKIMFLSL